MKNHQIVFTAKSETIKRLNDDISKSGLTRSQLLRRIVGEYYNGRENIPETLLAAMEAAKAASKIEDRKTRLEIQKSLNNIFYLLGGGDLK